MRAIGQRRQRVQQQQEGIDVPGHVGHLLVGHQPGELREQQRGGEDLHGAHAGVEPAQIRGSEGEAVVLGRVDEPDRVESVLAALDTAVDAWMVREEKGRAYRR